MFGGGSITQEAADYIRQNEKNLRYNLSRLCNELTNIPVYELPAGEVLMAVGMEMVDLSGFELVDGLTEAGGSSVT